MEAYCCHPHKRIILNSNVMFFTFKRNATGKTVRMLNWSITLERKKIMYKCETYLKKLYTLESNTEQTFFCEGAIGDLKSLLFRDYFFCLCFHKFNLCGHLRKL